MKKIYLHQRWKLNEVSPEGISEIETIYESWGRLQVTFYDPKGHVIYSVTVHQSNQLAVSQKYQPYLDRVLAYKPDILELEVN
jgi:hypothetical protein